ncbi:MAG: IS5 family transposase [Chromatiaceae bacterium]|nr:MAG: IS5 family transposase [Chromatiaceae bacterium]
MRDNQPARGTWRYDSDVTDTEWYILGPLIESCQTRRRARPLETDLREILNAIFYLNKTGCPWRYRPKDFPDDRTVNDHYNKWRQDGTLAAVNDTLRELARTQDACNPAPTAAIIDSQSVKGTPESALDSGFDGGKLVKGRKRHIVVDTMGDVMTVRVHSAGINDGQAALAVLETWFQTNDNIRRIWADSADIGHALHAWVLERFQCVLHVIAKQAGTRGFKVLPRRWVVERSFTWLIRSRRLSKDDERLPNFSEAQVELASIRLLLRRLTDNQIAYAN